MRDVVKRGIFEIVGQELHGMEEEINMLEALQAQETTIENINQIASEAKDMNSLAGNLKNKNDLEALHTELTNIYAAAIDLAAKAINTAVMARKEIVSNIHLLNIDQGLASKS